MTNRSHKSHVAGNEVITNNCRNSAQAIQVLDRLGYTVGGLHLETHGPSFFCHRNRRLGLDCRCSFTFPWACLRLPHLKLQVGLVLPQTPERNVRPPAHVTQTALEPFNFMMLLRDHSAMRTMLLVALCFSLFYLGKGTDGQGLRH